MKRNTLDILQTFYKEGVFHSSDLLAYDKEETFKITHMPLEIFIGKIPIELTSKLLEPCFLKNKHYEEDMHLILKTIDKEINYFLTYTAYYKSLLEENYKITDEYHIHDLNIIALSNKLLARHLMTTAIDINSLRSKYHKYDMDILKEETSERAELLNIITTNENSLKTQHHIPDIDLLTNQKNDEIFFSLLMVAEDECSLKSRFHRHDMDLINRQDNPKITIPLSYAAISKYSLENNHIHDLNIILKSKSLEEANKYAKKLLIKNR